MRNRNANSDVTFDTCNTICYIQLTVAILPGSRSAFPPQEAIITSIATRLAFLRELAPNHRARFSRSGENGKSVRRVGSCPRQVVID